VWKGGEAGFRSTADMALMMPAGERLVYASFLSILRTGW
jgi:hypothetical protein